MLKNVFGKKGDSGMGEGGDGDLQPFFESQFVQAFKIGAVIDVRIETETVTDRESRVLTDEIAQAAQEGSGRVTLDMSKVEMLASAGIGTLVQTHKKIKDGGGKFAIYGMNDDLMNLMKLTRMHKLFTITDSRESAISAVS